MKFDLNLFIYYFEKILIKVNYYTLLGKLFDCVTFWNKMVLFSCGSNLTGITERGKLFKQYINWQQYLIDNNQYVFILAVACTIVVIFSWLN